MPNHKMILKIFKETGALLRGHFKLSSGLHSAHYLQCALVLQHPRYAEQLCKKLAARFKDEKVDCVFGAALGGVVVSYEVARALGVKSLFAEREGGKLTLRRGFKIESSDSILVVEDVITTGGSVGELVEIVKSKGAKLIGVGTLVDRSDRLIDFGCRLESLIKLSIEKFKPEECPLCEDKIPLSKPGSRKIKR